jgi:hypothetical protein
MTGTSSNVAKQSGWNQHSTTAGVTCVACEQTWGIVKASVPAARALRTHACLHSSIYQTVQLKLGDTDYLQQHQLID